MSAENAVIAQPTLSEIIEGHASLRPDAIAFIAGDASETTAQLTWREYHCSSNALAMFFIERGYRRGDKIGILLPDGIEVHVAFVACEKAGLVAVGISPRAGEKEIAHVLGVSGSVALLSISRRNGVLMAPLYQRLREQLPSLRELLLIADTTCTTVIAEDAVCQLATYEATPAAIEGRRLRAEELFLINSTSGTTGMPKCVSHHQARWLRFVDYVQDSAPLTASDVFLCAVPASVGFGLWFGHFTPALLGATTVLLPKFSVTALVRALALHRVTVLAAVSTQLTMLLGAIEEQGVIPDSLRILYTGGEAVPFERAARFEALTNAVVLQFYGSNEAGGLSYTTVRDSQDRRLRTAGRIIPEMNVTLVDPETGGPAIGSGRPVCRGPLTSLGYFNDDTANRRLYTEGGFLKMDDIVRIDELGYLTVVGRIGDFIIRGGKNISAAAVEESALMHPAIATAAAVAMPDVVFGEKVCLYVTLAASGTLQLTELIAVMQAKGISKENFPERLIILEAMPQVSGGKVAKQVLRDDIRRRVEEEQRGGATKT